MSNSEKYIPKVGEAFEFRCTDNDSWEKGGEILAKTEKALAYPSGTGFINVLNIQHCQFRPISTKSDVEREQLKEIMQDVSRGLGNFETAASEIQNAGFTIPKKVKRSDLSDIITLYLPSGFGAGNNLTNDICNLLGDLVEDEA